MANTWTLNGSVTLNSLNSKLVGPINQAITINGSNGVWQSQNVTTGSWIGLDTGSLTDLRYAWFTNTDVSSSILIATGSAGQNQIAIIQPSDDYLLPWSGSLPLYAKAIGSNGTVVLQYILTES